MTYAGEMLFSPSELRIVSKLKSEEYLIEKRSEALRMQATEFFKIIINNERMHVKLKHQSSDRDFYDALDNRQLDKSALELFSK
ncbi:hypothetical protein M900_1742 [Bacteriovorax sp. Seq25_V]|nr:hypothetical protein M900_1742 [Bacteriovorax sp. Seq25_V]